jgi:hypothetical protein
MEAMRQSWTDDRLDDLSRRMEQRFDHIEGEMKAGDTALRAEMKAGDAALQTEMKEGFDRVDRDLRELRTGLSTLQRTMIQVGGGLIAANLTLMAGVIGLMVTQL